MQAEVNMKRTILATLSTVLLFQLSAHASEPLSLAKVLELAAAAPRQLASDQTVEAAAARLAQAKGAFMPSANISETFRRTDDPVGVFSSKLQQGKFAASDLALDTLNNPGGINLWATRVEAQQPIIHSGVDIYKKKAAEHSLDAAEEMNRFSLQNIRLQAATLYYQAVALRGKVAAVGNGIAKLKNLEASYEQADAPSTANESNYMIAKSIRSELEAQNIRLKTMEMNTRRLLAAVIGSPDDMDLRLTDPLPTPSYAAGHTSDAEFKRSDVAAVEAQVKAAEAGHKASKWSWGPNLDAFAAYNRFTGDYTSSKGSYEAGVMMSWPVFRGHRTGEIREAEAMKVMAQKQHEAVSKQAEAERRNSFARLKACIDQYRLNQRAVAEATKALDLAAQRYAEGTLPLLDYSQAIQNWTMMHQMLVDNHYSVAEAYIQKRFQTGDL